MNLVGPRPVWLPIWTLSAIAMDLVSSSLADQPGDPLEFRIAMDSVEVKKAGWFHQPH